MVGVSQWFSILSGLRSLNNTTFKSDLDHGRVKQPSDLVTIGQNLKVKITKIDKNLFLGNFSHSFKVFCLSNFEK